MAGGGGGGGGAPKVDEPQPHPPKEQLPNISYCITSPPPWPDAILLGFQHYIVMLGTSVLIPSALVPQMGGGNEEKAKVIQTLLFVAGLNTLQQTLFGTRLPAVIGGSYTFVPTTISIILAGRFSDSDDPIDVFKPTFSCSLVALVGFGLYELGFPVLAKCVEIGLPELVILVFVSQYMPHIIHRGKPIFDRFAVIFSIVIVWIYAHLLTVGGAYDDASPKTQASCRTDRAGLINAAPWLDKSSIPLQWGAPSFDAGEAFAMMAALLLLLLRLPISHIFVMIKQSTGAFIAVSRYASATPVPPAILSRGVGWQGVGILISGLFGTVTGSSVSVENAGLLALTRVGSRRVVQISAGFMIFFSILGKFGAVFASIPGPIIAALYCLFFAYVGFSIFMGLSVPQYFNEYTAIKGYGPVHTGGRWFNDMINVPLQSEAFVAGCVAYFLDNTLHRKDSSVRKDRGKHWWDKFRSFKGDSRSEEFYSLPFNLNKYFPSV
ncbi:hypothetical protein Pyn_11833 [Prunus yedoensis var. nudiflora]|uniref:Nucleobase-ascorbate transporter 6 n=1 Tax=Prunus yedoensis var. nudiflora TaxID=2094558 RepID=A0A314Y9K0_PRUYE|nr:hypothetical protein Pyn_11833 [Prunus yedoensis var. nudiflora]